MTGTTGTPSAALSFSIFIFSWLRSARSNIVSATTTGWPVSITWVARYRLRTRFVASTTATTASGLTKFGAQPSRTSRAISSSREVASRLYSPGRSTRRAGAKSGARVHWPTLLSTVTPG